MTSSNNITIELCSDDDLPACFAAMAKGFDHDSPFFDIYYPGHDTEIGQLAGSRRLLAWKKAASESSFLKATLNSTPESPNKIIGFAVWTLMEEVPSANIDELDNVNDVWPDAGDAEYIRRLWRKYVIPRSDVVASSNGAGIYVLELLSVDKAYQRQGAGLGLVNWGTQKADELGLESIVESTPAGRRTYEKGGFRAEIEQIDLDTGSEFADRNKPVLTFLRRSRR